MNIINKLSPKYRYFWDDVLDLFVVEKRKRFFVWERDSVFIFEYNAKYWTDRLNATN